MTLTINAPQASYSFGDTGVEPTKVSISGVGTAITTKGQKTIGGVEVSSASNVSGRGVVLTRLLVKVPIWAFDTVGALTGKNEFVQAKLEVTVPNNAGLIATSADVGSDGAPTNQAAANAMAMAQALQMILAMICNQGAGTLVAGKSLVDYTLFGSDLSNPITRGAMGILPLDGTDRSIKASA